MNRSLRAWTLASASGLAAASSLLAPPALAACVTVVTTTTCTGTSGGGAIGFGPVPTNGNTVINQGTLTGTTDGIQINDGPNVVQNTGTISGGVTGIDFVSGSGSSVSNDGTVIGGTTAIVMTEGNSHALTNNGSLIAIGAVSTGILMDGISGTAATGSSIINNGSITAGTAIDARLNGGIVTNNAALSATDVAIRVGGPTNVVTNNGTITAARGILVLFAGNTVTNVGTITASNVAIDVTSNVNTVTNTGRITAPIGIRTNGATNTIVNSGLITAAGGIGVSLTGDTSPLTNNGTIRSVDTERRLVGLAVSTAGAATVTNNGVLDGGLSIGGPLINNGLITISVPGTNTTHTAAAFLQTAAGALVLRADMAGNHDSLQVAGTATLGGTLLLNLTPRFFNSQVVFQNVVAATTFGGTRFATVSLTLPPSPFIVVTTQYATPTGVFTVGAGLTAAVGLEAVSVILTPVSFGGVPGLTINQREVGGGLDRGCAGPLSGAGNALCTNVLFAPSVNVLDTLSGEVFTGVQNPSFTIGEQFLDAMLAQVQRRRGQPCGGGQSAGGGSSGRSGRFGAWASGFGTLSGHRDGDTTLGSARLNASDGGAAAGGDMCLGPNLRIGFAFGGASSQFTLDGRAQDGNTRAGLAGTYGSWASGPFYVDVALAYGHSDFSTTRNIALNAITERATADFTGNQFASRLEAGFHMRFGGYSFIPFIGATGQVLRQNGASESAVNTATGQPGIFGLNTQAHTSYAPLPTLGASASKTFAIGETATITPRLRVSWGYETSADRQSSSSFQALSGASFTVNGARPARSALNVRAGVDGDLFGLVEFYAQVDSAIAAGGNGFSAAAGVRMAW